MFLVYVVAMAVFVIEPTTEMETVDTPVAGDATQILPWRVVSTAVVELSARARDAGSPAIIAGSRERATDG